MTHLDFTDARPGLWTALKRSLSGRCPHCGEGRLFASYLNQVEHCSVCEEPFGHIRSDDAAPWLTILIVGHIVVPLLLAVEREVQWPEWFSMTFWPAITLLLALLVLPRAKALFVAIIWATEASGSEKD